MTIRVGVRSLVPRPTSCLLLLCCHRRLQDAHRSPRSGLNRLVMPRPPAPGSQRGSPRPARASGWRASPVGLRIAPPAPCALNCVTAHRRTRTPHRSPLPLIGVAAQACRPCSQPPPALLCTFCPPPPLPPSLALSLSSRPPPPPQAPPHPLLPSPPSAPSPSLPVMQCHPLHQ